MTAFPDTPGAKPAARLCRDEPVLIPLRLAQDALAQLRADFDASNATVKPPERDARVVNDGVGPCPESAARRGTVVEVRLSLPASARNGRA